MIEVNQSKEALEADPSDAIELYERLQLHIGRVVRIRNGGLERSGVLFRLSIRRNSKEVFYSFDAEERELLTVSQHVGVLIDGSWRTICRGNERNRSLRR